MRKMFILFCILISVFFNIKLEVNAGVCDGKEINMSNGGYCSSTPVTFNQVNDSSGNILKYGTGRFSAVGFTVTGSIYNGGNGVAFCIDPALKSPKAPTNSYSNVRELHIDLSEYDKKTYMMYQKFINDSQYNGSVSGTNLYRASLEAALRVWTIKNGFSYIADDVADYKNEAKTFAYCAKTHIDNSISDSGYSGVIIDYTCFGDTSSTNLVKRYYDSNTLLWEHDIKKENISIETVEPTASNPNYQFKITVPRINSFFAFGSAISVLSLEQAKFKASIFVGNNDCSSSSCNATITNNITGNTSVELTSASATNLIFTVTMTKEQYIQNVNAGNVKISLKYEYNHPMSIHNAYFSRNNTSVSDYQRMFGIVNYLKKDVVDINLDSDVKFCEHIASNNYVDNSGNTVNLNAFIDSCGCSLVKTNLLSNYEKQHIFNKKCVSTTVTSNLSTCTLEESVRLASNTSSNKNEKYNITFDQTTVINEVCNLNCVETIDIENMIGKYDNVKAGTYFQLNNYPTTTATKKCTVSVRYASWYSDFINKLNVAVNKYNDYKYAESYYELSDGTCCINRTCNCDENNENCSCCPGASRTYYKWGYGYTSAKVSGSAVTDGGYKSNSGYYCGSDAPDEYSAYLAFVNALSEVSDALDKLNECNTYLSNFATNDAYYPYQEEIKFVLEQTVYNSLSTGGYEKKLIEYVNDKIIKKVLSIQEDSIINNYTFGGETKAYGFFKKDGIVDIENRYIEQLSNRSVEDYTITRQLERKHTYTSNMNNYTNSSYGSFGEYSSLYTLNNENLLTLGKEIVDLNSVVKVGDVYDINIKALAKEDNNNYFEFTKLGDSNQIYKYFKSNGEVTFDGSTNSRNANKDDLKRYCTYETINELVCIPGTNDSDCLIGDKAFTKILFKVVDPNNIDPNGRISASNKGFENWKNEQGYKVMDAINNSDTFNPENLEYSFTLDSKTIKSIREYNETSEYSDYINYDCDDNGNYCLSGFIDAATNGSFVNGYYFDDSFASIEHGRSNWKMYDKINNAIVDKDVSYGH